MSTMIILKRIYLSRLLIHHTRKASLRKMTLPLSERHFSNASKFQSLKLCDPFEAIFSVRQPFIAETIL